MQSDENVAASVVRSYQRGRGWLRQKLFQRGIAKPEIDQALGQRDEPTELALAQAEAAKVTKTFDKLDSQVAYRRLVQRLLRRGFAASIVQNIAKEYQKSRHSATVDR